MSSSSVSVERRGMGSPLHGFGLDDSPTAHISLPDSLVEKWQAEFD
jgi:hypothetical protein